MRLFIIPSSGRNTRAMSFVGSSSSKHIFKLMHAQSTHYQHSLSPCLYLSIYDFMLLPGNVCVRGCGIKVKICAIKFDLLWSPQLTTMSSVFSPEINFMRVLLAISCCIMRPLIPHSSSVRLAFNRTAGELKRRQINTIRWNFTRIAAMTDR